MKSIHLKILIFLISLLLTFNLFSLYYIRNREETISNSLLNQQKTPKEQASNNLKQPAEPDKPLPIKENLIIGAWIPHFDYINGINSAKLNTEKLSEIHFASGSLDSSGRLSIAANTEVGLLNIVETNIDRGINIYSNDSLAIQNLINSEENKSLFRNSILELKSKFGLSSVNLNFESVNSELYPNFIDFLEELKNNLNTSQVLLYLTFFPNSDNLNYATQLSEATDYIVIMSYDYVFRPDKKSGAELANAPDFWVEEICNKYTKALNPKKLTIGLPLYGYGFNASGQMTTSYTYSQIQSMIVSENLEVKLNSGSGEAYIEKANETIYFQTSETLQRKAEIIRSYNINKIFYWRLGGDEGIFNY